MTSRILRVFGLVLLVLAVSPLTAPFATCDLSQLPGQPVAPGVASVQVKAAADEPAADLGCAVTFGIEPLVAATRVAVTTARSVPHPAIPTPLRV